MDGHNRFSRGFGICILHMVLALVLAFLLIPPGVPSVLGAHDDIRIPKKSTIIETQNVTVTSDNETELSTCDNKIKIKIPKGTVDETMDFQLNKHFSPSSTGMQIINFFELNAKTQESNKKVHEFKKQMEITIQHTPEELAGLDVDSLCLYYLNEEKGNWIPIDCKFDEKTLTLTAEINHFSYFGEQANPLESGPGKVMAAQVSLSSGTATYSYPFELPPGPGGFTPSLTLNYNSGSVDGMKNKRDVGSWVGIGWSLKFGSISYNAGNDEYNLDLNGASYKLVTTDDVNFHTQPEEYLNIVKSGNTWTIYDKSGTYYRFGGTVDSEQYTDGANYYRWDLSYWQDTNGNEATVSYVRDIWNNSVRSAYPEYLRYNNNLVEVHFTSIYHENGDSGPVRLDNPVSYGTNPVPKIMENRQLDTIEVKVSGNLIRKYAFAYETTDRVYSSDYDGIYYSGAHTLTSITQLGADGVSSLPSTSFTYEDKQVFRQTTETQYTGNPGNPASLYWPFLTEINSGYGGTVSFTYTQIPDASAYDIWTRQAVTEKTINGTTESSGGSSNDTTTMVFYPDANAVDGYVYRYASGNTWSELVNGAGTGADASTQPAEFNDIYSGSTTDKWDLLLRTILLFDTSNLPDDATITSAKLSLYGYNKQDPAGWNPSINVYSSNPASNTNLIAADYGTLGSTTFCDTSITYTGFSTTGYNDFNLNASGTSAISKTGITKLGIRNTYDAENTPPAWSASAQSKFWCYMSEQGEGYKPRLEVTYSIPRTLPSPKTNNYSHAGNPRYFSIVWDQLSKDIDLTSRDEPTIVTFYPDANAVDGYAKRETTGTTWADIHDGAGTYAEANNTNQLMRLELWAGNTNDTWKAIERPIIMFDTSSLPDDAVITSATLSVRVYSKSDPSGWAPSMNVYSSNPASSTNLVPADYSTLGTTAFCNTPIPFSNISTSEYNDFPLNTYGLASISNTGVTKLGLRFDYDATDTPPTWSSSGYSYVFPWASEGGINYTPKLEVTYTIGEPPPPPPSSVEETYTYTYTGNPDYSSSGWNQEFYGWNEVTETDAVGNSIKHYFYTTGMISGKSADHFRGKEYSTKWYDAGSPTTPVKEVDYDWVWEVCDPAAEGFYLGDKTGGTLSGTNELAIAPDESVYVTSLGTQRIVKYDSNLVYVPSPFDNIQIPSLRGIATDSQGYIYVTCNAKEVRKYSNDGTLITEFSVVGIDVHYLYDIAVPPSGDIYVIGECNAAYKYFVLRYDSTGNLIGQYFFPYLQNQLWTYFQKPFDIEIGSDGYIYITTLYFDAVIYQPIITIDYISSLPQDLSSITNSAFGSEEGEFGLGISDNNTIYITGSPWTEIYNLTTGKRWGNQSDLVDVAVGENYIYTITSSNAFKYSRTNWLVKLNKVEETTLDTKTTRTEYVYDDYGNVIRENRYGDISTGADNSTLHRVFYPNTTANILNKPAEERVYATITEDIGGANLKKETHYYYDYNNTSLTTPPTQGNLTRLEQKSDAANSISSYNTYDSYGNLLNSQDPNSNNTTWTFETTYHVYPATKTVPLVGTEYYTYAPGTTNLLSMTDVNGQTTTYEYDTFGRLLKVIKPGDSSASPSVAYQYNDWGTINYQNIKTITKVDETTFLWQTQYFDGLGRVVQVHTNGEAGHTIIAGTTSFNNRGMADKQYVSQDIASVLDCYQAPDEDWKYSTSTYDALGRVVTQTGADGTSISHDYSTAWQDTVTNQRGYQTRYFYDAFRRLVKVEELDDSYQLYATTTYTYDVLGNLVQVVDNDSNNTTITYDWLSRKTAMVDPDMGAWSYTYDNNGNLITQTDAKSQTITMVYDALNRLVAKIYPVESGMTNVSYGYDSTEGGNYGIGQRTSMTDAIGTTTYLYDNRGRMIREKRTIDAVDYTTLFTYDGADRPVTITYPTGENVTQTYDGRGLPYSLSGTAAGNLVTGTYYNQLGSITEINLGNGLRTTYGYYGTGGAYDTTGGYYGKLWEIKTLPQIGGDALQDVRHTWDAGGNLETRTDVLTSLTEFFTYDFLDRLLNATSLIYTEYYTYNTIGNIMSKNGVPYTYGTKPHAVTSVGENMTYTYDANGNMITRLDQTLNWDAENRLVSVSSNSTAAFFIYDGDGNRVKKIENGETVLYVNRYHEVNLTTGNTTSYYYHGSRLVAKKTGDELHYLHQDHLSGTSLTTDSAGNAVGSISYLPFGETLMGSVPTDKKFTGQRLDGTGLYYYGARYYDATIGRFISPDTVMQSFTNPQNLNRYSYTMNNPLKYIDPSGNYFFDFYGLMEMYAIHEGISFVETSTVKSDFILLTARESGLFEPEPHILENNPVYVGGATGVLLAVTTTVAGLLPYNEQIEFIAKDTISLEANVTHNKIRGTTSVNLNIQSEADNFEFRNVTMEAVSLGPLYYAKDKMGSAGTAALPSIIQSANTPPYCPFISTYLGSVSHAPSMNALSSLTVSFNVNADPFQTGILPSNTVNSPSKITFNLLTGGITF